MTDPTNPSDGPSFQTVNISLEHDYVIYDRATGKRVATMRAGLGDLLDAREYPDDLLGIEARFAQVEKERDHLVKFKDYVHKRLDDAGVPVDPESVHKAAGCRIGGRLDWVFALKKLEMVTDEMIETAVTAMRAEFIRAKDTSTDGQVPYSWLARAAIEAVLAAKDKP